MNKRANSVSKEISSIPEVFLLLVTEQLLVFPATLTAMVLLGINSILAANCVFLLFSCLIIPIYALLPRKAILPLVVIDLIAMASILVIPSGLSLGTATSVFIGVLFILRSYWLIKHRDKGSSFYTFVAFGFFLYLICAFIYSRFELFKPFMSYLAFASTFAVTGGFFGVSFTHIGHERVVINKISVVPKITRSSNTYLLTIFSLVVLIVASLGFIDRIVAFLSSVWSFLKNLYGIICDWMASMLTPATTPQGNAKFMPPEFDEAQKAAPSLLSQILSQILYYLGLALISICLAYALYVGLKKIIQFFNYIRKKIAELINRIFKPESLNTGYNDEISSLLEKGESLLDATRKWIAANSETDRPYFLLRTNSERARWLYKKIVRRSLGRGLGISGSMTSRESLRKIRARNEKAAETAADSASMIYDNARYGSIDPKDAEIDLLRDFHQ